MGIIDSPGCSIGLYDISYIYIYIYIVYLCISIVYLYIYICYIYIYISGGLYLHPYHQLELAVS